MSLLSRSRIVALLTLGAIVAPALSQPVFKRKLPSGTTSAPAVVKKGSQTGKVTDHVEKVDGSIIQGVIANRPLYNATTVDAFIEAIPDWIVASKKKPNRSTETDQGTTRENKDGRGYNVTRKKYSITETPDEIVTYQPVNGFWLGAIVQQKGLKLGLGSMQEVAVPSDKRAPFNITTDLPSSTNFRTISAPSQSQVESAIGSLKSSNVAGGGARTMKIVDNFSETQTAMAMGLSARYITASVSASLSSDRLNRKQTITASFIERAFTATADFEGRSRRRAFFNDSFTIEDAKDLVRSGRVSAAGNLPTYIKSISYGRVVIFNLTSTLSQSEMKAALAASVNAVTWGVDASFNASQKAKNTAFELRITEFGGSQNGFSELIPATGINDVLKIMKSYLQKPVGLTGMVPISYTVNTLRDDQLAALSVTTEYTVTLYTPDPIGERFKITMWVDVTKSDDGVADNTLECYGLVRVNGDIWWQVDRNEADTPMFKREAGEKIEISGDGMHTKREFKFDQLYDPKTPFNLQVTLRDYDGSSPDDNIGIFNLNLDLVKMGEGITSYGYDSGDDEATRLNIKIERTDYL